MDPLLVWIIAFSTLGGALSVLAASGMLLLPAGVLARALPPLVSFAIGAMLGAAFLGLLPHAIEGAGEGAVHTITLSVLLGLLLFFVLEKMVIWRHCHTHECEAHGIDLGHVREKAAAHLILIGDAIHNLVDGVLIAAAFLTDIHLGVVTAVAVIAHEIPQELGDFAILLHGGYSRGRALLFNLLASLTTVIGGVVAYASLSSVQAAVPYVLAVAASSFIYIAVADLIPGLHKRPEASAAAQQIALIGLGVALIYLMHSTVH